MSGVEQVIRQPQGQPQRQPERHGFNFNKLLLGGAVYFGLNLALSYFLAKDQRGVEVTDPNTGKPITVASNLGDIPAFELRPSQLDEGAQYRPIPRKIAPIWPQDSHVDVVVTLSPSFNPIPISETPAEYVVLQEKNFHMGNGSEKRTVDTKFTVPKAVQNNGTLWGHFYVGLTGSKLDPRQPGYDTAKAYHFAYPLTQYLPKKKTAKTRNLLDNRAEGEEPEEEEPTGPIISSHYHPNASFAFVPAMGVKDFSTLHPAVKHFLRLEATGARDGSGQDGWYYPLLFINNFWQLTTHMTVLNETVKELPLHIDLTSMAFWKFSTLASIELNSKETARQAAFGQSLPTGGDGSEIEMVKEIFIDTNPILLGITIVVSIAHVILETLAFGSDIAHYRKKKDNVGISVRSILANVFMQTVIFLYLLDNSQNTSWMILGSQVVGIVIEFWKVTTVVDVRLRPSAPGSLLPYSVVFEDKHKLTETEEKTKEYDAVAFKYMYIVAVPLLIAYGIYSLVYESHKSWYSFIITTLVGSVYAYGFLMMVPSLYINYRLKSVAHMPAKAMMYKFLNTFIDDLFAFTIKMPFLHRLATFRDDIIFFIYIYQRWAYKTDYTRVNEFGQGGEDEEPAAQDKDKKDKKDKEAIEAKTTAEVKPEGKATGTDAGKATKRK
ncbi:ClpTM1 domain-containing protein [Pochonia chlamydosporia 170]|uniref:ClpTM1 domain-containing protein n=1 Tax=Pochonia chlamydosporia 170 TaxID=1380566 RepID=A0A179FH94_METCM|nr:ClpTM1 domain-containing protein [Pochonia chlamydosporia 170]OAQ64906.1 ClpTM1 domain-containing protein [Pochonia chlamydosporia 170]